MQIKIDVEERGSKQILFFYYEEDDAQFPTSIGSLIAPATFRYSKEQRDTICRALSDPLRSGDQQTNEIGIKTN